MVNAFLTCSPLEKDEKTGHRGYRISASKLDFKRLNKQVTEAIQILDAIESLHILGVYFKNPCPTNPYLCYKWIRDIMTQYKKMDDYLFCVMSENKITGKWILYSKTNPLPKKLAYDEKYEILENGNILYKKKKYSRYTLILPGDMFIGYGFKYHPIVCMYLNHPESLRHYINEHVNEFISRGGKPGSIARKCFTEKSIDETEHPIWTLDPEFHKNHKAALLTKELARKEKQWYINFPDFCEAYECYKNKPIDPKNKSKSDFSHYIWPFSQDLKNPRYNF